ncbi:hypothetical protein AJ80_05296 [Polytolypa hystricis UAMH7299]|uniref:J domain-containing protein n=1 Tax=Polytolypa hystricis (strain UAMH7299) TaxID=1447883 RepID=A0A2B7Y4Z7_POLH7|nr:hypothetical protein AJ80_05296 [Polytolypa hystricis UAMH7299]
MGQGQSSSREGGGVSANDEAKTDYYELLSVDRSATDEEIKKAYRRKALELHPDRNYGNVETATSLFAQVQSAYEVLSDPQERAWYDSHRDAILFGQDSSTGDSYSYDSKMTTTDDVLKLFMKFNPRMDFSDAPSGFFGGLRETFDRLAQEEAVACKWEGLDPVFYPSFGSKDDPYDDIRPFYSVWGGFSTQKSFSWKDVHRYSEAPDRRVRRLMEKENKRLRDEAIREFNDAVRSLAAFVKKRDPRYKATVQSEAERQKSLRDAAAAQAARSRAAYEAKLQDHVVPEWAQTTEDPNTFVYESEEEESYDHFECVVCRKTFKSEKQFEAHERSKKHLKAVKQLRWEMGVQDKQFRLQSYNSTSAGTSRSASPGIPISIVSPENTDQIDLPKKSPPVHSHPNSDDDEEEEEGKEEEEEGEDMLFTSHTSPTALSTSDASREDIPPPADRQPLVASTDATAESEDGDELEDIQDSIAAATISSKTGAADVLLASKLGKAKQKRAKKLAAQASLEEQVSAFRCARCQAPFPSKTKLFNHINELNHAQPLPNSKLGKMSKKGSRR